MRNGRARRRFLEPGRKQLAIWATTIRHSPGKNARFSSQLFDLAMNFQSDPFSRISARPPAEGGGVGRISHFSRVFRQLGWVVKSRP